MNEGIFIAMPVYRGQEHIEETARSIRAQTYGDFRVLMSVDGRDDPTIAICEKLTSDPRFELAVQEERLGWPGNFNWLVEQCDQPFFCYWQQDDLASTSYLEQLRNQLVLRPDAAIAYTDVQWFGARFDRNGTPSIEGDPLSRVMQHVEAIRYEPLRGLIRASMLPEGPDPIPVTEDESCQEEFVFLTSLAAAGAFLRVESAMYFKRLHTSNVFNRWATFPDWRRRRGWISMGKGMYEIAAELADEEERPRILAQLLDRLSIQRHGRAHFYLPSQTPEEVERFVRDFVSYTGLTSETLNHPEPMPLERPVHKHVLSAIEHEQHRFARREELAKSLDQQGTVDVALGTGRDNSVLGFGWSNPEDWGVWSDGEEAWIHLSNASGCPIRITIEGSVHGSTEADAPVLLALDEATPEKHRLPTSSRFQLSTIAEPDQTLLRITTPNATSPRALGTSADERTLGFGLTRMVLELADR